MAYGDFVFQRELNFTVQRGEIFISYEPTL